MLLDKSEMEQLLDVKGCFQSITVTGTGKLTIHIDKGNNEKQSMVIHFPSSEDADNWVNTFFNEFATASGSNTLQ